MHLAEIRRSILAMSWRFNLSKLLAAPFCLHDFSSSILAATGLITILAAWKLSKNIWLIPLMEN